MDSIKAIRVRLRKVTLPLVAIGKVGKVRDGIAHNGHYITKDGQHYVTSEGMYYVVK